MCQMDQWIWYNQNQPNMIKYEHCWGKQLISFTPTLLWGTYCLLEDRITNNSRRQLSSSEERLKVPSCSINWCPEAMALLPHWCSSVWWRRHLCGESIVHLTSGMTKEFNPELHFEAWPPSIGCAYYLGSLLLSSRNHGWGHPYFWVIHGLPWMWIWLKSAAPYASGCTLVSRSTKWIPSRSSHIESMTWSKDDRTEESGIENPRPGPLNGSSLKGGYGCRGVSNWLMCALRVGPTAYGWTRVQKVASRRNWDVYSVTSGPQKYVCTSVILSSDAVQL